MACDEGLVLVVRALVEAGADLNQACQLRFGVYTPLCIAALRGHLEVVQYLVREGRADVNQGTQAGCTPLYLAAFQGNLEVVQWLVREGNVDVNQANRFGETPLFIAGKIQRITIVRWLSYMNGKYLLITSSRWLSYMGGQYPLITSSPDPKVVEAMQNGHSDRIWADALVPKLMEIFLLWPIPLVELVASYAKP